jgi:hypothetical protein
VPRLRGNGPGRTAGDSRDGTHEYLATPHDDVRGGPDVKARAFIADHAEAVKVAADGHGGCTLCGAHEAFYKHVPQVLQCPKCQALLCLMDDNGLTVVGSTNFGEADEHEELRYMLVGRCVECEATIALVPTVIHYNANHDIYYTGGRKYVDDPDDRPRLSDKIRFLVENYTERLRAGESLGPEHLMMWLEGPLEEAIASWMVKHELKPG